MGEQKSKGKEESLCSPINAFDFVITDQMPFTQNGVDN